MKTLKIHIKNVNLQNKKCKSLKYVKKFHMLWNQVIIMILNYVQAFVHSINNGQYTHIFLIEVN